ncbi:hypothetical protein RRM51_000675 [Aeromonas veronii]|nr:hypothetical protein [Aeromonas veronii]
MCKEICLYFSKNKLVNFFLVLSVAVIVSFQLSMSMPVWYNWNVEVVNYYYNVGVNLSMGYIVSTIFYVLVVYYPERKKKLAIKAKTFILFARLQTYISEFVNSVLASANVDLDIDDDIKNSYQEKLVKLELIDLMRKTKASHPFGEFTNCLEKAIYSAKKIEILKGSLVPFVSYLDDNELDLYLSLEDTFVYENFYDDEALCLKEMQIKSEFHYLVGQYYDCQKIVGTSFRKIYWQNADLVDF